MAEQDEPDSVWYTTKIHCQRTKQDGVVHKTKFEAITCAAAVEEGSVQIMPESSGFWQPNQLKDLKGSEGYIRTWCEENMPLLKKILTPQRKLTYLDFASIGSLNCYLSGVPRCVFKPELEKGPRLYLSETKNDTLELHGLWQKTNFVFISTSNQSSNPTTPFIILTPAIAKGNFALCVDPPNKESKSYNVHFKNISDVKEASSFVYDASKTCTMLKETKLEVYLAIDTTSGIMMAQRGRIANQKFVVSSVRQPADNSKK